MKSTKKRRTHRQPTRKQTDKPTLSFSLLGKSLLITVCIGLGLILLSSLCVYFLADPAAWIPPASLTASALTAFLGGVIAVRLHGHSALLCGLCNGAMLTAIMLPLSLLLRSYASGLDAWVSWGMHALLLLLSVAGAAIGLQRPRRIRRKR